MSAPVSERTGWGGELGNLVLRTTADSFRFYLELAPDGRRLDERETTATLQRLEQGASCGRVLELQRRRSPVHPEEARLIQATLGVLRAMQHSMLLALSHDGEERVRAMPVPELKGRMYPVHAQWPAGGQGRSEPGR